VDGKEKLEGGKTNWEKEGKGGVLGEHNGEEATSIGVV